MMENIKVRLRQTYSQSGKEAVPTPRREKFRHLFGKPRDSNSRFHSIQIKNKTRTNEVPLYMEKVRRTQGLIGQKPLVLQVLIVYLGCLYKAS